jgi:hypothetical protein
VSRYRAVLAAVGLIAVLGGAAGFALTARAEVTQRRERVYLAELSMVLEGARRLLLWAETYPADSDFARFAYPLSERYVDMAGHMTPPGKLAVVHPHLLLVVENVERAMAAAAAGDQPAFRQRTRTVREELASLDGVLKQLKLRLPELAR